MASSVGWACRLTSADDLSFRVAVGDRELSFLHADASDGALPSDSSVTRLLPPWTIAARNFSAAIECKSGHLTVLAPIGCYTSPLKAGGIDAVVLDPALDGTSGDSGWTCSYASIGHSRCWILNIAVFETGIKDEEHFLNGLMSGAVLAIPAEWKAINDTATLSEFARDCGRSDGRFPEVVVLSARLLCTADRPRITAWLAFTDAVVSVALAEAIGAATAPEFSREQRFRQLQSSLEAGLRSRL